MLELTGLGSVLRGIGLLYWLLAFGAIGFAIWRSETWKSKALWAGIWIAVFGIWPTKVAIDHAQRQAYAREAWAYFKKKCDTEAGEKIYKTFTGVKSVLVIKPLPPATEKDLYDQFWYGDPYSNATPVSDRGTSAALKLASLSAPVSYGKHGRGYDFVEVHADSNASVTRYFFLKDSARHEESRWSNFESRFGIEWEDISTPGDRKYWVAGSRLRIVDLADKSVIAERVGYLIELGFGSTVGQRRPWLTSRGPSTTCPVIRNGSYEDRWFILKVLMPPEELRDGK